MTQAIAADPLGLRFTGRDHSHLATALMAAYPTPAVLNQMLVARLDQPLAAIAAPYPLADAAFEVITHFKARGHLLRLIEAARASQPDNPELAFVAARFGAAAATPPPPQLEKLVRRTSVPFPVAVWRARLARRETCVCRVEVSLDGRASFGTGFLVGADLVLTNHHVVASAIAAVRAGRPLTPDEIACRFDYKQEPESGAVINDGISVGVANEWLIDSSPHSFADVQSLGTLTPSTEELDFALLRLETRIGEHPLPFGSSPDGASRNRGWIDLPDRDWAFENHDALFIIQHPKGGPMQLALDVDADLTLNANGTRVTYRTGTEPGSSGSPCFNRYWNLVALHHGSDPI